MGTHPQLGQSAEGAGQEQWLAHQSSGKALGSIGKQPRNFTFAWLC